MIKQIHWKIMHYNYKVIQYLSTIPKILLFPFKNKFKYLFQELLIGFEFIYSLSRMEFNICGSIISREKSQFWTKFLFWKSQVCFRILFVFQHLINICKLEIFVKFIVENFGKSNIYRKKFLIKLLQRSMTILVIFLSDIDWREDGDWWIVFL